MTPAELQLQRLIGGEPTSLLPELAQEVLDACARHGIAGLVLAQARSAAWPERLQQGLRAMAFRQAAWEGRHQKVAALALQQLAKAGIGALVFKGSASAYSVYGEPYLRQRADTDVLVDPAERHHAADVLRRCGFHQKGSEACEFLSYEATFYRVEAGFVHMIDLHWRVHYSQAQQACLRPLLSVAATPLPRLCPAALGAEPAANLVLTCVHRSNDLVLPQWQAGGPTWGNDRWIVLHDVCATLAFLEKDGCRRFVELAAGARAAAVCLDALQAARAVFGAQAVPADILDELRTHARQDRFTTYHRRSEPLRRWDDWTAVRSWRDRVRYLGEHAFPPREYLEDPHSARAPRLARLLRGLGRHLRSPSGPSRAA